MAIERFILDRNQRLKGSIDDCAVLAKHVGESARSRMAGDSLYLELLLEHFLLQNLLFLLP
jgi:hypothetical protein